MADDTGSDDALTEDTAADERGDADGGASPRPARETDPGSGRPLPTPALVLACLAPLVLLTVVLVLGRDLGDGSPASPDPHAPAVVAGVPAPQASSPECGALVSSLPGVLGDARRVDVVDPAPPGVGAYRLPGGEVVVVRCGLDAPAGFRVGSAIQMVDDVAWFREEDPSGTSAGSTWVTVDRPRNVVVTLPDGSGTGPIQDLSRAVSAALPRVEPRPAPAG